MKATNIKWDLDDFEGDLDELQMLPDEIEIPEGMTDDGISDYISDITGFCHCGYDLVPSTEKEYRLKVIHYLTWEDEYLPLNAYMVRSDENIQNAINSLLDEGIIRMRDCEGAAVELNTAD